MIPSTRIFLAVAVAGAIPFVATLVLALRTSQRVDWAERLIPYAVGTMLGAALFHLIPESLAALPSGPVVGAVFAGMVAFFALDALTHVTPHPAPVGVPDRAAKLPLYITSDALHNFVDGLLVATTFLEHPTLGIVTALAVAMHELPRELGTFALCISAGLSVRRALWLNAVTAGVGLAGAILAVTLGGRIGTTGRLLVPFAAGTFLYLAASITASDARRAFQPGGGRRYAVGVAAGIVIALVTKLL